MPVARPLAVSGVQSYSNVYTEKTCRPLPDSAVRHFMQWIHTEQWESVPEGGSTTEQVAAYEKLVMEKVDQLFPEKKIRVTGKDKEFITAELKTLDRKKKREWKEKGRSDKYMAMRKEFKDKYKKEAADYLKKCVTNLKKDQPGKAAATLKRMGAQPGDCMEGSSFTLLSHIRENLTVEQQLERLTNYFVSVSQEFPPLHLEQLSDYTRQKLLDIQPQDIPTVEDYEIFNILDNCTKKKSSVPGDIPPRLFYGASAALAAPAARIMNNIAQTGEWPTQYKTEWGVPLEKTSPAEDESQTRIISCTNKMNIVLEKQVVRWLMKYVGKKLDPDQFGGLKGNSISHYLIEMTNLILYNQDLKDPQATLALFLDYKQGFTRCQHSIFIEILSKDYNLPGWLLRILIGYCSQRKLQVRYKQNIGEEQDIPGGGGQGVPLGLWIFLFMIDSAGPKASSQSIGSIITQPNNVRKKMEKSKKKWIDDFTLLASIDLKRRLVSDPAPVRPVPWRGRTEHILPRQDNVLQDEIDSVVKLSQDRNMTISKSMTKAILFNPLRKYDFLPQLSIEEGSFVDVVEEQKILGYIMRSDMKTISNTEYICKRAYRRMWVLRRLKSLGCPVKEMIDVLKQQIVSICEGSVAFWGPMITQNESNMLERCLKTGLHIIFQDQYLSFNHSLKLANMKSLKSRRLEQITSFSKKAIASEKYKSWFCKSDATSTKTRWKPTASLKPVTCRTQRYQKSSLPLMTRLLAWHPPLRYTALDLA